MSLIVDMPGSHFSVAVAVEEKNDVGEVIIVGQDIGEVRGSLAAFVYRRMEGGSWVIYCVYSVLPAVKKKETLICVFSLPNVAG